VPPRLPVLQQRSPRTRSEETRRGALKEAVAVISVMAMLVKTLVWAGIILLTRWRITGTEENT
jgi:hypothetical protein